MAAPTYGTTTAPTGRLALLPTAMRHALRRFTYILLLLAALTGCRDAAPERLAPGPSGWKPVVSERLGVRLRVPSVFDVVEEGDNLLLRYHGTPARLILATPDEAARRGLWTTVAPGEAVRIAGRDGHRYVYNHHDGPFYSHTIAYVFSHRGRQLGIEFRTDADVLDAVQAEMLASLTFTS